MYIKFWRFIENSVCKLQPLSFISDYESAIRSSIMEVYNLELQNINGCYFHYAQALRKRASQTDYLLRSMKENHESKSLFKKFVALALLPASQVCEGFEEIKLEAANLDSFTEFLIYFENFWIKKVRMHFCIFFYSKTFYVID